MKKDIILKVIIVSLIFVAGCSSEKAAIKPPSEESVKVKAASEILLNLSKSYEGKDERLFMFYVSQSVSSGYENLETRIKRDFTIFEKINLNMTLRWARVKEDAIQLAVHWEGRWFDQSGKERRERGNCVFSFRDEEGLKLARTEGDSPFGISRER